MPRSARFKIDAVAELYRQLEYAPLETRRRQMDAVERLINDIDPAQNYPEDFITFRITGYRPDRAGEPVTLVGQALLPDLVHFVLLLSEGLGLRDDDPLRPAVAIEVAAKQLGVSTKTIQRYRKQGLVCHAITYADGVSRLGVFADSLARFEQRYRSRLKKAAGFTRIDDQLRAVMIEQARQLRETSRCSLNEAALRIARVHDRAHETIRNILSRHDRTASEPIFSDRGPLTEREQRVIHRAWEWGIEPAELAKRFGKTKPTIHRAVNRIRRDRLRAIDLEYIGLPTFDLPDAAAVILASPAVTTGLRPVVPADLLQVIAEARDASPLVEDVEDAMVAGYNLLKARAAQGIAALGDWPGSEEIDAIETELRWSLLLERRLIVLSLPMAVRRIEQNLGRALSSLPSDEITRWMTLAIDVARKTIVTTDPSRGQRLERMMGLAMDKAIARRVDAKAASAATRASARHPAGTVPFAGLEDMYPWERWLQPRRDVRERMRRLDELQRTMIVLRYGLDGTPPLTVAELAERLGMKAIRASRQLQRVIRQMRGSA